MRSNLVVNSQITIPARELSFSFSRASGKGGQNVNKVNSKATLIWSPWRSDALSADQKARFLKRFSTRITQRGELKLSSAKFRDQQRNIDDCCQRLAEMVRAVIRPPKRRIPTNPGQAVDEARLRTKKARSIVKDARRKVRGGD